MEKDSRIYVAGHKGLVGSAIERLLKKEGYRNLITIGHNELDLRNQQETEEFFKWKKPEYVFMAAAKVGGITANINHPAEFILDNLQIQTNVINSSWKNNVKKLMYFGSCCAYPTESLQPIKEEYLHTGKLEPTNEPFAIAKLAGIGMCQAYNKQYGCNFISVIPSNLYGPNDNFHPKDSHMVSMAIRRINDAKKNSIKSVVFGGTGDPVRDWLYIDDLAESCLFLMEKYDFPEPINIGTGKGVSKKNITYAIKDISKYNGEIIFDSTYPDGMMKRVLDVSKINSLGWFAKTDLMAGLEKTYEWYLNNIGSVSE